MSPKERLCNMFQAAMADETKGSHEYAVDLTDALLDTFPDKATQNDADVDDVTLLALMSHEEGQHKQWLEEMFRRRCQV